MKARTADVKIAAVGVWKKNAMKDAICAITVAMKSLIGSIWALISETETPGLIAGAVCAYGRSWEYRDHKRDHGTPANVKRGKSLCARLPLPLVRNHTVSQRYRNEVVPASGYYVSNILPPYEGSPHISHHQYNINAVSEILK